MNLYLVVTSRFVCLLYIHLIFLNDQNSVVCFLPLFVSFLFMSQSNEICYKYIYSRKKKERKDLCSSSFFVDLENRD